MESVTNLFDDEILYFDPEDIGSEDEDDIRQNNTNFNQAVIWGTDWTTETVVNQITRNNIDLFPKFQRRDAWSNKAKSKFIESLFLGLPIPQIILAEKQSARGKYIVIDGKQRLLTLRKFFSIKNDDEFIPLKLSGLEILSHLNGKTYKKILDDPSLNGELTQLENQSIRTTIIKNWPNETFLYTVFLRLNTGSIKLSPQELRQALHPGQFIDFADEFSYQCEPLKTMLNLNKPDYRMRDVEIVIRFFANKYFLNNYDGNLKTHFDNTVKTLNDEWDNYKIKVTEDAKNFEKAISFTIKMYGNSKNSFSKWVDGSFQNNFNRAIFDIMVYYFSNPSILNCALDKQTEILNKFKDLCETDNEFLISFEHTTKSIKNTFKRLTTWGEALAEVLGTSMVIPYYENGQYIEKNI